MLINGEHIDARSGERFAATNPATGTTITEVALGDAADIDTAVTSARMAFDDGRWSQRSPRDRGQALIRLAELIHANADELQLLETLDVGKPIRYSGRVDVNQAAHTYAWYGEAADKLYGEIAPTGPSALGLITREPLGVVGAVTPWNFPMMMNSWKLAPALLAGNSVVLKPAEQSPLTAIRIGEIALEAGIPPGVLNVVPGYGETAGRALGLHPLVDGAARPRTSSSPMLRISTLQSVRSASRSSGTQGKCASQVRGSSWRDRSTTRSSNGSRIQQSRGVRGTPSTRQPRRDPWLTTSSWR